MAEMAWDREAAEASTYYALLDIVGEEAAQRIEASERFGELVDDYMQARLKAEDDADDLAAFLHAKVRDL